MGFLAALPALFGIGSGIAGIAESAGNSGTAKQAAQEQNQIAAQEAALNQQSQAQKMAVFQQLMPFFQQYLQPGSPFLSMIQQASAGQNAQNFGNAAGQVRGQMQTSGLGYGPSGTTGAALGQLGTQSAQQSSSDYLQNLLNNENIKFQAAKGINDLGSMFNFTGQNMPTNQVTQTTTGSSVNAFGQALANLLKQFGTGNNPINTQLPQGSPPGGLPPPLNPPLQPIGPSPTQGFTQ